MVSRSMSLPSIRVAPATSLPKVIQSNLKRRVRYKPLCKILPTRSVPLAVANTASDDFAKRRMGSFEHCRCSFLATIDGLEDEGH
jgi:hypothetical protein